MKPWTKQNRKEKKWEASGLCKYKNLEFNPEEVEYDDRAVLAEIVESKDLVFILRQNKRVKELKDIWKPKIKKKC